jgi:hypothetical protein
VQFHRLDLLEYFIQIHCLVVVYFQGVDLKQIEGLLIRYLLFVIWNPYVYAPHSRAIQHEATILKELDSMPPDAFWAELSASLIPFYKGLLKVPGAGGRPEARTIKRPPPAAAAPPPAEVSMAASWAGAMNSYYNLGFLRFMISPLFLNIVSLLAFKLTAFFAIKLDYISKISAK